MAGDDMLHVANIQPWLNTTIMTINADGTNISLFANGTEVGHLIYMDGHWSFAGNVDASAQALFDALALVTGRSGGDGA